MANDQGELGGIDGIEIEPLSDEALEDVAGGSRYAGSSNCCSCTSCSSKAVTEPTFEPGVTNPAGIDPGNP